MVLVLYEDLVSLRTHLCQYEQILSEDIKDKGKRKIWTGQDTLREFYTAPTSGEIMCVCVFVFQKILTVMLFLCIYR